MPFLTSCILAVYLPSLQLHVTTIKQNTIEKTSHTHLDFVRLTKRFKWTSRASRYISGMGSQYLEVKQENSIKVCQIDQLLCKYYYNNNKCNDQNETFCGSPHHRVCNANANVQWTKCLINLSCN